MSIRIRTVDGIMVALCAARSIAKPGDVYLNDAHHHALAEKFRADYTIPHYPEHTMIREQEESNNPNREWWDSVYGAGVDGE